MFITLPQRESATNFPPYGPMAVMNAIKKHGYLNLSFFNLDLLRPTREQAIEEIAMYHPDVLAISAPISTAYENCKFYADEIKKMLPDVKIVLGGNLAASAEIILRKTSVDYCVIGEGEQVTCALLDCIRDDSAPGHLRTIKGIAFLENNEFVCTGYADQLAPHEIFDVDWDLLDAKSIDHYFRPMSELVPGSIRYKYFFHQDDDAFNQMTPEDAKKTMSIMSCSKGCIGKCTYCHRFTSGIRIVPVDIAIRRLQEMVERFNIGALDFGDECFGVNKKWLAEFCEAIKPMHLKWKVAGMRVDMVSPDIIRMMKNAGCRTIVYGMESGSERILNIMEKKVFSYENYDAINWTTNEGIFTIPQLVIGMPGETDQTIMETAEFVTHAKTLNKNENPREISITFAQALPGTPLYEYARSVGEMGLSIDEEEAYLLQISNRNAADDSTTMNFTDFPRCILLSWPLLIRIIVEYRYAMHFGKRHYRAMVTSQNTNPTSVGLFMRMHLGDIFSLSPSIFYRLKWLIWLVPLIRALKNGKLKKAAHLSWELVQWWIKSRTGGRKTFPFQYKSLRKILSEDIKNAYSGSKAMEMLRKGK